jgi:hypothetical protein
VWTSEKSRAGPAAGLLVALAVLRGIDASAADAVVRVNTSTINSFLSRIDPVPFNGRYAFRTTTDLGIFGRHTITWCNSAYSGSINNLAADITTTRIRVQGDVAFSWCGLNFGAPGKEMVALGNANYRSSDSTLRLNFPSVVVRPTFNAFGFIITLPVPVDLSGALNFPAIPVRAVGVGFDTDDGQRVLRVRPTNVDVDLGAGFVSISSDLVLN